MKVTADGHRVSRISLGTALLQSNRLAPAQGFQPPWDVREGAWAAPFIYILSVSCSRVRTRLMTWEAGWTGSYSANRWHTFSCDSVWLLATNPKILMGENSLSEVVGLREAGRGEISMVLCPAPSPAL